MIKLPDFILVPYQLLEDKEISLVDERLYGIIYWFSKLKNEKCTASNTTFAELVKTSSGMIRNSLSKLDKMGYIQRIFKDKKKKIRSEIIPLVVFAKVSPLDDKVSLGNDKVSLGNDKVSLGSDTRVSLGSEQNKNIYNKNNNKNNKEEYTSDFLSFYENYPKKELKKTSFQIWQRKKLEPHLQVILDFIKKARETDRWQKGYIKQPPAFLNGECWNDDLSAYGDKKTTTVLKSSNPNKYDKFKIN